jgi:ketosteroid isomerase-like protein
MDDLHDRLARIEDERAIVAILYRYGDALDHGDRDEFLDCFTPDAQYLVHMRMGSSDGLAFEGHEQLREYFDRHTHAPAAFHKHVTVNPLVTVNGAAADAQSYFLRVDSRRRDRHWCWRRVGTSITSSEAPKGAGASDPDVVRWRTCDLLGPVGISDPVLEETRSSRRPAGPVTPTPLGSLPSAGDR